MLQETQAKRSKGNILKKLGAYWNAIKSHLPWQQMAAGMTSGATAFAMNKALNGQQKQESDDQAKRAADQEEQEEMLQGLLERDLDEELNLPVQEFSITKRMTSSSRRKFHALLNKALGFLREHKDSIVKGALTGTASTTAGLTVHQLADKLGLTQGEKTLTPEDIQMLESLQTHLDEEQAEIARLADELNAHKTDDA